MHEPIIISLRCMGCSMFLPKMDTFNNMTLKDKSDMVININRDKNIRLCCKTIITTQINTFDAKK